MASNTVQVLEDEVEDNLSLAPHRLYPFLCSFLRIMSYPSIILHFFPVAHLGQGELVAPVAGGVGEGEAVLSHLLVLDAAEPRLGLHTDTVVQVVEVTWRGRVEAVVSTAKVVERISY